MSIKPNPPTFGTSPFGLSSFDPRKTQRDVDRAAQEQIAQRTRYRDPNISHYKESEISPMYKVSKKYDTGPIKTGDEEELSEMFGQLNVNKSGQINSYSVQEQEIANNLISYFNQNNNIKVDDLQDRVNELTSKPGNEKNYIFLVSELWKTLTEILFFSAKLVPLNLEKDKFDANADVIFQTLLTLFQYAYSLLITIIFFPFRLGEKAEDIWKDAKKYTIGLGIFIIIMIILYQTSYGKIIIDLFIDATGYMINTDIRLKANEFLIYMRIKAMQALSLIGFHNYITSLFQGAATNIGKEVGQQIGKKTIEQVGQHMSEVTTAVQQTVKGQLSQQASLIVDKIQDPMQLAMLTAGVEGGRQATLMINNQLLEQAKLTYNILESLATKHDFAELKDSIKEQLQANEFANMLLTNQDMKKSSDQLILSEINKISEQLTPIMSLMEEDVKLLNVLIEAMDSNQELNKADMDELLRLTDVNLKTTNLGRIINNWNIADSQTVIYGLQSAINGINILRGQNPIRRQFLLEDGPAGGRKTRKRRVNGKRKGKRVTRKKLVLKKLVKSKANRNGKRKGRKGKTCKKK